MTEEIRPWTVVTTKCTLSRDPGSFGIEKGWKRGEGNEAALVTWLALSQTQFYLIFSALCTAVVANWRCLCLPRQAWQYLETLGFCCRNWAIQGDIGTAATDG